MDNVIIYKYPESKIVYTRDKGIVVVIYEPDEYGPHSHGDKWTAWFDEHQNVVKVQSIERCCDSKDIGLCFGDQFCEEEIRQMKTGRVWFTKS